MTDSPQASAAARPHPLEQALYEVKKTIVGQDDLLERMIVALLARGHLLVEGVPGLAKTMAIKTLADAIGGDFQRIQFTPDLVPADLVGTRIYNQRDGEFQVSLGPVFANLVLADEINRAPAKVQSALLEVMQERQVTIGRETYPAPDPFLVMATQNPIESEGTYAAPRGAGRPVHAQGPHRVPHAARGVRRRRADDRHASPRPSRCSTADSLREYQRQAAPGLRRPGGHRVCGPPRQRDAEPGDRRARPSWPGSSPSAPARAPRSTWSSRLARSPSCAAATTRWPPTCATWPATCCGTASCCPTRRWPRT